MGAFSIPILPGLDLGGIAEPEGGFSPEQLAALEAAQPGGAGISFAELQNLGLVLTLEQQRALSEAELLAALGLEPPPPTVEEPSPAEAIFLPPAEIVPGPEPQILDPTGPGAGFFVEQIEQEIQPPGTPPPFLPPGPFVASTPGLNIPEEGAGTLETLVRDVGRLLQALVSVLPSLLGRVPSQNQPPLPGSREDPFAFPFPTAPVLGGVPGGGPDPQPSPPSRTQAAISTAAVIGQLIACLAARRRCEAEGESIRRQNAALFDALLRRLSTMPFAQQSFVGQPFSADVILDPLSQLAQAAASRIPTLPATTQQQPGGIGRSLFDAALCAAGFESFCGPMVPGLMVPGLPATPGNGATQTMVSARGAGCPGIFTPRGRPRKVGMVNGFWFAHAGTPKTWTKVSFKHPHRHHHHPR